jgi:glycine cleavage system H protein
MTVPDGLLYTPEHEWVSIDGTIATVGITAYAAEQLGDIVYVSAPSPGTQVTASEPCGEVESVKSVSDIYSPVDGEVIQVNDGIEDDPAVLNADPYGEGWLFRVRLAPEDEEPSGLLSSDEYAALTRSDESGEDAELSEDET